jgi:tetratricopeptide (TPR) repeat protein
VSRDSKTPTQDIPHETGDGNIGGGSGGNGRSEPRMGWIGDLDFRAVPRRIAEAEKPVRWLWWGGGILIVVLLGLALLFRQSLADRLWPQTRAQALRTQAAQALREGKLTAEDGSGARELYEAALAIDPDRNEARLGLSRVAVAAVAQARSLGAKNRFAEAHATLKLARELSAPRADILPVERALREREAAHAGLPSLLARANAAAAAGRLIESGAEGGDAALPLYKRVLALQPENKTALEGREDALGTLLQQTRAQLREGKLAEAVAAIALAREYDPGHVDLPDTEARLNEELDNVRRRAGNDLRGGRLERAANAYRMLADAGLKTEAEAGLEQVAKALAQRAEAAASDFRFADANRLLDEARTLSPRLGELAEVERHIERARQSHARLGSDLSPRERARRVKTLLEAAAAAESRGDLLTPPGDSAFDKLRAARALAPDDPAVKRASARLLPTAKRCFEEELRGNNLARAGGCLDARAIAEGETASLAQARRRLAQRWLAVGDERLGAGEVQAASAALASARRLDPSTPGIAEFEGRVKAASAGK